MKQVFISVVSCAFFALVYWLFFPKNEESGEFSPKQEESRETTPVCENKVPTQIESAVTLPRVLKFIVVLIIAGSAVQYFGSQMGELAANRMNQKQPVTAKATPNGGVTQTRQPSGVPVDSPEQEFQALLNLATAGDASAQSNLGFAYFNGQGVPQDHKEGMKWWLKAAEQGHAQAQFNLGLMYDEGLGVKQDPQEAVKWYRKSAEQGDAQAQVCVGHFYSLGKGVPQDHKEAAKWYLKAAEQGHSQAQVDLGGSYYSGEGVPQNYVLAHMWTNLAAAGGIENAVIGRDAIAKEMTRFQIEKAQTLAREKAAEIENRMAGKR